VSAAVAAAWSGSPAVSAHRASSRCSSTQVYLVAAIGAHRPVQLGVLGDAAETPRAVLAALGVPAMLGEGAGLGDPAALGGRSGLDEEPAIGPGYRTDAVPQRIAREARWRDVPYPTGAWTAGSTCARCVSRWTTCPGGVHGRGGLRNFMGYPSMYLSVPDADGFCFTQAYQAVGLGLASAVGAAIARRPVAGGRAWGAIGRGFGCAAVTVRGPGDLARVQLWLPGPRDQPLVVDAKVTASHGSWWLEEAFRGH
jgi:acetolactate synthase I/II/III large subunit